MSARLVFPAVVLALAVAPRVAPAALIGWTYSIAIDYPAHTPPAFAVPLADGGTGAFGYAAGNHTYDLPAFQPVFPPQPAAGGGYSAAQYDFTARVTILDVASGESAEFRLPAVASESSWWGGPTERGVFFNPVEDDPRAAVLGGNRYAVDGVYSGVVRVQVSVGQPPEVPEPGTLALAGVGLAGAWFAAGRRRAG